MSIWDEVHFLTEDAIRREHERDKLIERLRETGRLVTEEPDGTLIVKPINRKEKS